MKPEDFEAVVQERLKNAIATGLNSAAEKIAIDTTQNTATRPGQLRDPYAVIQATPDNLEASIGNSESYREEMYPFVFKQRSTKSLSSPNEGDFAEVVQSEVETAITIEFS